MQGDSGPLQTSQGRSDAHVLTQAQNEVSEQQHVKLRTMSLAGASCGS